MESTPLPLVVLASHESHTTPGCSNDIMKDEMPRHCRLSKMNSPRSHVLLARKGCRFDSNLLRNLLITQRQQTPKSPDYFQSLQSQLKPSMRRICVEWMNDVCHSEYNDHSILNVAVNLLDRFLAIERVYKDQLQTVATTCMLIASKIVMPQPFTCSRLSAYTENSCTVSELMSWEMLILSRLGWDVSSVTSIDFVQPLLTNLHLPPVLTNKLRPAAYDYCKQMTSEFDLSILDESLQAAVAVCLATKDIFGGDHELMSGLITALAMAIDSTHVTIQQILDIFSEEETENKTHENIDVPDKNESVESDEGVFMDESTTSLESLNF